MFRYQQKLLFESDYGLYWVSFFATSFIYTIFATARPGAELTVGIFFRGHIGLHRLDVLAATAALIDYVFLVLLFKDPNQLYGIL